MATRRSPFSIFNSQFSILNFLLGLLVLTLLLAGCASTRPVVKIGLIAPFEGLYRDSGYEALAAMRMAIADSPLPSPLRIDILPLALDDSADPQRAQRAAAKMLADPAVAAVVGPLFPALGSAVSAAFMADENPVWLPAFGIDPVDDYTNLGHFSGDGWAIGLVQGVAAACRAQGCTRLILAGDATGWPSLTEADWRDLSGLPVVFDYPPALEILSTDGILWLGFPDAGADYLTALRRTQPSVPFWLASAFGTQVFMGRAELSGPLHLAVWLDDDYEKWAMDHTPNSPAAYQIYRATQAAITAASTTALSPPDPMLSAATAPSWNVQILPIGGNMNPQSP